MHHVQAMWPKIIINVNIIIIITIIVVINLLYVICNVISTNHLEWWSLETSLRLSVILVD